MSCKMTDFEHILKTDFWEYESTFKETSFDNTKNEYLCQDVSQKVYDFDKILTTSQNSKIQLLLQHNPAF